MNRERILYYLEERNFTQIKEELTKLQPVDIADLIDELDSKNAMLIFRLLNKEAAVDVFSFLSSQRQENFSLNISEEELKEIIKELAFDDKIDYLEEMPANVVKKILKNTSQPERRLINQFLNYPENTAGSLMTIEFVDLKKEMTVKKAINHIRQTGPDKETVYICYVINEYRKLEGIISLKDLVLAPVDITVKEVMKTDFLYVTTAVDQEHIANTMKRYDLLSIPVVDNERRLVGIITIDDIMDVVDEENTEDFHKMAALQPTDRPYLETGIISLARKRIFWLAFLMISATFTGYIIRTYEFAIEAVVSLAVFIPMLMDTGGNAGAQTSTLIIREMALGQIELKDGLKVIWKEIRVSLLVGLTLGVLNFGRVVFLENYGYNIAFTVSLTLVLVIAMAKVTGSILPLIAKKMSVDPAIMASPLITTIVDALALLAYFSIATVVIGI